MTPVGIKCKTQTAGVWGPGGPKKVFLFHLSGFVHLSTFGLVLSIESWKKYNHISVSGASVCFRNWWPFWNGGYSYQLTISAYKYQPKLTGLKPPQSVIFHDSMGWFGAGQRSHAGLSWALLQREQKSLGKLVLPHPHGLASWSGGLRLPGIKGEPYKACWGHALEVTCNHFHNTLLLTSGWEKQQMSCHFLHPSAGFYISEPCLLDAWNSSLHSYQPG